LSIGVGVEDTLLLDSDASGACKELAIEENISKKNKTKEYFVTHLELYTR